MNRLTFEALGVPALRWSLVLVFALFGLAKFAPYEAAGVAQIAQHYWLFGWLYPLLGQQGASDEIGTLELLTGALIAAGAVSRSAGLLGALMGVCVFLVTLSFMIGAPKAFEAGYGFPYLGATGQFLMKDAVLFAACAALALVSWERLRARSVSPSPAGR